MAAPLGQLSRFALLRVEDDDSDEQETKQPEVAKKGTNTAAAQKKKNKKKKRAEAAKAENAELRNLAFCMSGNKSKGGGSQQQQHGQKGGGSQQQQQHGQQKNGQQQHGQGQAVSKGASADRVAAPPGQVGTAKQWEQWKKADEEFTTESYEKDLEQALLASKLDFEHQRQERQTSVDGSEGDGTPGSKDKKKKKKDKVNATMTLEEFNQLSSVDSAKHKPESTGNDTAGKNPPSEPDPKFFDKVEADVTNIIRKEKIQEVYKHQFIVENARSAQYQDDIEKRDKEITRAKETNTNLEAELKQVKKRNQQLCHILAQGEMKDKVQVLMELEELRQVRDELTQDLSDLNTELEKERSKVHAYKTELDKIKGSKHSGK